MTDTKYGLLIDYDWCTGCHSCEMACSVEHDLPKDQFGIKVHQLGPWEYKPDTWEFSFIPTPTKLCDMCTERTTVGKLPTCVHHCQAKCMKYGPLDELKLALDEHPRQVLFSL